MENIKGTDVLGTETEGSPQDYAELVSRAGIFPAVADFTKNTEP